MTGSLLEAVLPSSITSAEIRGELPQELALFPEEAHIIQRAVPHRQREFSAIRVCARRCLTQLGELPVPLLHDNFGAPVWPDGIQGSMTHCRGFSGAALGRAVITDYLGIDAEPNESLAEGLLQSIATYEEIRDLPLIENVSTDKLLFSAKEAVYKALYPIFHAPIDFLALHVEILPDGALQAHQRGDRAGGPAPVSILHGRWHLSDGVIATAFHASSEAKDSHGFSSG